MAAKNEQGKKPQLAYKKKCKNVLTEFEQGQQPAGSVSVKNEKKKKILLVAGTLSWFRGLG